MASFPQFSIPKSCKHFFTPPFVPHVPPILCSKIRSPELRLMKSANNECDYYAIFCNFSFPPLQSQVSSSLLHFQPPSSCVSFKDSVRVSHPCTLTDSSTVLTQGGAVRADRLCFDNTAQRQENTGSASEIQCRYTNESVCQEMHLFTRDSGSDTVFCSSSCQTATAGHVLLNSCCICV